jgi:hypothetical protein
MIQDTCYENQTDKKTTQLADEPNGRAQTGQESPMKRVAGNYFTGFIAVFEILESL